MDAVKVKGFKDWEPLLYVTKRVVSWVVWNQNESYLNILMKIMQNIIKKYIQTKLNLWKFHKSPSPQKTETMLRFFLYYNLFIFIIKAKCLQNMWYENWSFYIKRIISFREQKFLKLTTWQCIKITHCVPNTLRLESYLRGTATGQRETLCGPAYSHRLC